MNYNTNNGDMGHWWRTQSSRSMDQLDDLVQYKLNFGKQLGDEKCKEIEADTNLYADADQFRIYHAKGRFRGTICAAVSTAAMFTVMNGGRNGIALMGKQPALAAAAFVGNWIVFYQFWSRWAGYNSQKYNEFQYARVHKMLRNIQVRQ